MENTPKLEKVEITVGPPGNPYAKIILTERRKSSADRRRLKTYIANDRRGKVSDRRKPTSHRLKRVRTEDRRQLHTYLANDRRSGIADRRDPKKRVPSWWRNTLR
jgi:hypothetical protein